MTTPRRRPSKIPPPGSQYGLTIGSADAPHKVVVYEDFLCPICGEFEAAGHEQLAQLADQGKVQIEYRPFIFLDAARAPTPRAPRWCGRLVLAASTGRTSPRSSTTCCSRTSRASRARSRARRTWSRSPARRAPTPTKLQAAIDAGDGVDWPVSATQSAESLGVDSTPTVTLDGEPFTNGRTAADLATNLIKAVQ